MNDRLEGLIKAIQEMIASKDGILANMRQDIHAAVDAGDLDKAEAMRTEKDSFLASFKEKVRPLIVERDELQAALPKDPNAVTLYPASIQSQESVPGE